MDNFICQYCGKECKNKNSLAQHEIRCKMNPNKIKVTSNFSEYNNKVKDGTLKKLYTNQFTKAKILGLQIPNVSDDTRFKLSLIWKGRKHTEEEKQKISQSMHEAVQKYPESFSSTNVNGRVKQYPYKGIKLDGQWEYNTALYLDNNNILWERPKIGFEYMWNNKIHIYYPDFYLPEYDYYIEVKGYQRERDIYKWNAVKNLIIIKAKEIKQIENNQYNIFDYIRKESKAVD